MNDGSVTVADAARQGEVDGRRFDHARWERLRREQMGVDAVDPIGHEIGMAEAAGKYKPIDGKKHVLVGEFDHYGWFNPLFSGAESLARLP